MSYNNLRLLTLLVVAVSSTFAFFDDTLLKENDIQIVTNNKQSTEIGFNLLKKGATVPEAFIAVSACEGLIDPQRTGFGGGFQAIIYNSSCLHSKASFINALELSPFKWPEPRKEYDLAGVGVPGMLKGYEYLYTSLNCDYKPHLEWEELFLDTIRLRQAGVQITERLKSALQNTDTINRKSADFLGIHNDKMYNRKLIQTLIMISADGPKSSMYKRDGYMFKQLTNVFPYLNDMDLLTYRVTSSTPTNWIGLLDHLYIGHLHIAPIVLYHFDGKTQ